MVLPGVIDWLVLGEARIEFLDDQPRDGRRLGQFDFQPPPFGLVGGRPARLGIVVHGFVRAELRAARGESVIPAEVAVGVSGEIELRQNGRRGMDLLRRGFSSKDSQQTLLPSSPA